jgi:hypothetical protein
MALIDNIQAYWKLDGTLADAVPPATYTMSFNGGVPTYGVGKINNGLNFVAASSQDSYAGPLSQGSSFSVSCWVKPSSFNTTAGNSHTVFAWTTSGVSEFSGLIGINGGAAGTNTPFSYVYASGAPVYATGATSLTTTGGPYHLVMTAASGGTIKLYVGGVEAASTPIGVPHNAWTDGPYIRCALSLAGTPGNIRFDGLIDEVGVWNRDLSQAEVTELNNGGAGLAYPFTGEVEAAKRRNTILASLS